MNSVFVWTLNDVATVTLVALACTTLAAVYVYSWVQDRRRK